MSRVNVHEVKARFSEYLRRVGDGETIVVCRRNVPVAELRPIATVHAGPRPVGLERGRLVIPDGFFEPLPPEELDAFDGGSST